MTFNTIIKGSLPALLAENPLITSLKEQSAQGLSPDETDLEALQFLGASFYFSLPPATQEELNAQHLNPQGMWQAGPGKLNLVNFLSYSVV